jgi:hypothetical protein
MNKSLTTNNNPGSILDQGKENSIKKAATLWLKERISFENLLHRRPDFQPVYSFPLNGFSNESEVFVQPTNEGVAFGYHSIKWEGHYPSPILITKHLLTWECLNQVTREEKEHLMVETLMKTINNRKRQHKTCQFCKKKFPPERLFDSSSCHGCATEHFGIIY